MPAHHPLRIAFFPSAPPADSQTLLRPLDLLNIRTALRKAQDNSNNGRRRHHAKPHAVGQYPLALRCPQKTLACNVVKKLPEEKRSEHHRNHKAYQIVPPFAQFPVASAVRVPSQSSYPPKPPKNHALQQPH